MKKLVLAALLALLPAFACAQAPTSQPAENVKQEAAVPAREAARPPLPGADRDADPALFVVRDEDTTIYLFGTFHLLDGRTWFNDEVKTAFDASSELVLEVLLPEDPARQQEIMMPLIMRYALDPRGRTISSRLTPAQNERLNRMLATIGVPPGALDRFEPWFVALTLLQSSTQQLGLDPSRGPETVLRRAAAARNLREAQLETAESQMQVLDSVPEEGQLDGLREMIDEPDDTASKLGPMLEAWSRGDVDRLAAMLNEDLLEEPAMYEALFTRRNANWARWIVERLNRPGTVFIAVGAGHLAGRGSVQEQLRTLGLETRRVPHVAAR